MLQQALLDAGDDDRLITEIELVLSDWSANLGDYAGMVRHAERPWPARSASESRDRSRRRWPSSARPCSIAGQRIRHDLFERAIELERSAGDDDRDVLPAEHDLRHRLADRERPRRRQAAARSSGGAGAPAGRGRRRSDPLLVRLARLESEAGNRHGRTDGSPKRPRRRVSMSTTRWIRGSRTPRARSPRAGGSSTRRASAQNRYSPGQRNRDVQMQRDARLARGHRAVERRARSRPPSGSSRGVIERSPTVPGTWGGSLLPLWSSDIEALIALDRLDEPSRFSTTSSSALAYPNPHGVAIAKRCEGLLLAARGQLARRSTQWSRAREHARQRPCRLRSAARCSRRARSSAARSARPRRSRRSSRRSRARTA